MEVNVEVNGAAAALALYRRVVQLVQAAAELQAAARQLLLEQAGGSIAVASELPQLRPQRPAASSAAARSSALPSPAASQRGLAVATRSETPPSRAREEITRGTRRPALRGARRSAGSAPAAARGVNALLEDAAADARRSGAPF